MAESDFQERTERATPRRREKAREEGKVARSSELNAAAIIGIGIAMLYGIGPYIADQTSQLMAYTMGNAPSIAANDPTFYKTLVDNLIGFFVITMPIFAAMIVIAIGINVAQVGFHVSPKALELKFDKLDLVKGMKRMFSMQSLFRMARDIVKLAVVGLVAYWSIQSEFQSMFLLPDKTIAQLASTMVALSLKISMKIGAIILVIAIIDYAYQKYEYEKSIKMSKHDLKEEYKETEGSPHVKSRIKQLQREMTRNRMMRAVPEADVVVTNPTHIAVALKYNPEKSGAPEVVAKGERLIAQRIKEIALLHGIPVVEDKPLARALFKMCEIGQVVPATLYRAVAEVLAYVYRLKKKALN